MQHPVSILCLCGKKRAGKNTAASALLSSLPPEVPKYEISFAEPLKKCVAELFAFSEDQVDGHAKDVPDPRWEGLTPRSILQFFGTEMMQFKLQEVLPGVGRHFWTRALIQKVRDILLKENNPVIVVTDMRFVHEYSALKEAFGAQMRTVRINTTDTAPTEENQEQHVSESEVNSVTPDHVIENNKSGDPKSLAEFRERCAKELRSLLLFTESI